MLGRHPYDLALAHSVRAEQLAEAADHRRARSAALRAGSRGALAPIGRLLVRMGIALGGEPTTLTPVRSR
jgi:hypothetical protein